MLFQGKAWQFCNIRQSRAILTALAKFSLKRGNTTNAVFCVEVLNSTLKN